MQKIPKKTFWLSVLLYLKFTFQYSAPNVVFTLTLTDFPSPSKTRTLALADIFKYPIHQNSFRKSVISNSTAMEIETEKSKRRNRNREIETEKSKRRNRNREIEEEEEEDEEPLTYLYFWKYLQILLSKP